MADEGKSPSMNELQTLIASAIPAAYLDYVHPDGQVVNGDTAVEHYYLYKRDIDRLIAAGLKCFSLTVAWTRILPFVLPGSPINSQGLQHYANLIDYIISKGMTPVVTLLHNDTPLQFFGSDPTAALLERSYAIGSNQGFQSTYNNVTWKDAFVHYGQIVMSHFADRVPVWISINEALQGCVS